MKKLDLKLSGAKSNDNIVVKIDGKTVKFKKSKDGNLIYNHQTENEKVKIEVFKFLNVGGFFWFITQLFFFLITVFGLFGTHYKEKCLVIDFELEVELEENSTLEFEIDELTENDKAVNIQTKLNIEEKSNIVLIDEEAKKVVKALKISKILLAMAIAVTILLLI